MRVALKPYLIYVPGQAGNNPHFRGGDDVIIPINRVDDPALMDKLMDVLSDHPSGIEKNALLQHDDLAESSDQVDLLLGVMLQSGVIWYPPEPGPRDFLWNYLSRFTSDVSAFDQRLSSAQLSIMSFVSDDQVTALRAGFDACGLDLGGDESSAELTVVMADFVSGSSLEELNTRMLETKRNWMLVRLAGPAQLQLGPIFIPGETACYECLSRRMEANRRYFSAYQDLKAAKEIVAPQGNWNSLHLAMAGQSAAIEAVKYLLGVESSPVVGAIRTIDFLSGETEGESLLRLPGCASCGRPDA